MRHEVALLSAIVLVYSFPAGLGVLIAGLTPGTGLSTRQRVGGIALLAFCIGIDMLLNDLQVGTGEPVKWAQDDSAIPKPSGLF